MNQLKRMAGRHIVVTGGGTGIGRSIAIRLAQEGAAITLMGRRDAPLQETLAILRDADVNAGASSCDIREQAEVDQAFAAAAVVRGPLYALVANAGIGGANMPGPEDRFVDLVNTNLTGTYWCLRAAQRHLEPGPGARHLLVISSILGRFGVPGYTGYCAAKTGLFGLVRALALELAADQVQVNAIAPGWVETEMAVDGLHGLAKEWGMSYDDAFAQAMTQVPLGRMSQPEEIAGMAAWLLSPDSRGFTGQGLDMNNGAWMG